MEKYEEIPDLYLIFSFTYLAVARLTFDYYVDMETALLTRG